MDKTNPEQYLDTIQELILDILSNLAYAAA